MGDSRPLPGFGQVDLEIEDDPNAAARATPPPLGNAFGSVELELGEPDEPLPPSNSRVFNADKRVTRKADVHEESTRVVSGDALSAITRPPPPLDDDGHTRAWAEIDSAEYEAGEDLAPPSSRGEPRGGSGSGVASRDDRVAAMRELYARGDAAGALALAATLGHSVAPRGGTDHPDASIVVEFTELNVDSDDPFGGLIPIDDELASMVTAPPPALAQPAFTSVPPAAHLTLTERQSIPRLLKDMGEVAKLKIDHRAGFLLTHVDGMQTLEEILDVCAMPSAEALELIANLKEMGVIELD